ncbi:Conserved_hypothetical protein [Hexamita inflata]|uniref:Myb-like domain-containing protein n=1 Tax=Hexamita inflata TaxID=28002 RepID=A0ABP1GKY3_9EUKA
MKQKEYLRWTIKENQKLLDLVTKQKNLNKLVNWKEIHNQFPNHTKQQLKSQYRNIQQVKPKLYHTWTEVDETILYLCVQNYGQDWSQISQSYFPNVSVESLRSKYNKYCKQRVYIHEVFQMLNTDDNSIISVSNQLLLDAKRHLDMFDNRIRLLRGIPLENPDDYDKYMGLNRLDLLEQKNAIILSEQYDILKLQKNMYTELRRRNLMK